MANAIWIKHWYRTDG